MKRLNLIKYLLIFLIGFCGIVISCDDTSGPTYKYKILTPEGTDFTLKYPNGHTKKVTGKRVRAWEKSSLLEGDYFRQVRGHTNEGTYAFRLSIPDDKNPSKIVIGHHQLRKSRLLLEQTGISLTTVQAEFYFQFSDEFEPRENAQGTVTIKKNEQIGNSSNFNLVGEVDIKLKNKEGVLVKITGMFWKKKVKF